MKFLLIALILSTLAIAEDEKKPDTEVLQAKIAVLEAQNKALLDDYNKLVVSYNELAMAHSATVKQKRRPNFLEAMGESMQKQASQPRPPSVHCTSTAWGDTTYTNCN